MLLNCYTHYCVKQSVIPGYPKVEFSVGFQQLSLSLSWSLSHLYQVFLLHIFKLGLNTTVDYRTSLFEWLLKGRMMQSRNLSPHGTNSDHQERGNRKELFLLNGISFSPLFSLSYRLFQAQFLLQLFLRSTVLAQVNKSAQ